MNQTKITKKDEQTLAPDELIDKTLYLMLQLTEEECRCVLAEFAERHGWTL